MKQVTKSTRSAKDWGIHTEYRTSIHYILPQDIKKSQKAFNTICLKFDICFCSTAAEAPVKFQNDQTNINKYLLALRLCKISYLFANRGPAVEQSTLNIMLVNIIRCCIHNCKDQTRTQVTCETQKKTTQNILPSWVSCGVFIESTLKINECKMVRVHCMDCQCGQPS